MRMARPALLSAAFLLAGVFALSAPPASAEEVTFSKRQLYPHYIAEGASIGDLNGDGHADLIAGPLWWKGPDFKKPRAYRPVEHFPLKGASPVLANYANNFFTFPDELTGDRWGDILWVGLAGQPGELCVNPAKKPLPASNKTKSCPCHEVHGNVCHESPQYVDVTGDGVEELLFFTQRRITLASPGEDATKPWEVRYVSGATKSGSPYVHGLGAGDVDGDGRADILEKDGWWQQPADWDGEQAWTFHKFDFASAKGGAQMYAYDFDGDGLNDVVTALDAHGYGLVWYQQQRTGDDITFKRHTIMPAGPDADEGQVSFSQPHALLCEDIDGDGIKDLITGKTYYAHLGKDPGAEDPAVLYWFKTTRDGNGGVSFVPHQIDDDSGIGRQFAAADVNGDGKLDLVTSNKKGVFLFVQE